MNDTATNELQTMIAETAQRLFSDNVTRELLEGFEQGQWPQALWTLVSDSGFVHALAPESAGGIGAGWIDVQPILRALGYWQVPLPLGETLLASLLLARAGIEIPEGPLTVIEQGRGAALVLSRAGTTVRVDGTASAVPWARHCRWLVISGRLDGMPVLLLLDREQPGKVVLQEKQNLAREPRDDLRFDGAICHAHAGEAIPGLAEPVWTLGALVRAVAMAGAVESLLHQSSRYATERVQFGRPIASYQAIQQSLAVLAGDSAAAGMAALVATGSAPTGGGRFEPAGEDGRQGDHQGEHREGPKVETKDGPQDGAAAAGAASALFDIAVAKVRVGEAANRATSIAHQVHGAIGFTYEHSLHYATRRLWSWRGEFGSESQWAERLGEAAIAAGSAGFWPGITQRRLVA